MQRLRHQAWVLAQEVGGLLLQVGAMTGLAPFGLGLRNLLRGGPAARLISLGVITVVLGLVVLVTAGSSTNQAIAGTMIMVWGAVWVWKGLARA